MRVLTTKPLIAGINKNDQFIVSSGRTYNEAGVTYSEPGYFYEGFSDSSIRSSRVMSLTSVPSKPSMISENRSINSYAFTISPKIGNRRIGRNATRDLYAGMSMGLLLALTYPVKEQVTL